MVTNKPTTATEDTGEEFAGMVTVDGIRYRPEDVPAGTEPDRTAEAPAKSRTAPDKSRTSAGK